MNEMQSSVIPSLTNYANRTLQSLEQSGMMTTDVREELERDVKARRNILVSGRTGAGKTSLVQALINAAVEIEPEAHIAIIDQGRELRCASANSRMFNMSGDAQLRADKIKDVTSWANRIILDEIRESSTAYEFAKACTQCRGGFTTIHAGDANAALDRYTDIAVLEYKSSEAGKTRTADEIRSDEQLVWGSIDLVVHLRDSRAEGRKIVELLRRSEL